MAAKPQFVQVAPDGGGQRISNFAITTWVDHGDGNGPQMQTVLLQATAVVPVDGNGNILEIDEAYDGAEWKRQMLDEMRAIRIGLERLNANRPSDSADNELSLIEEAQQVREDTEDAPTGRQTQ